MRRLPTERLSLRLTCRAADWPTTLETQLGELWKDEQVQVYHLYPLREIEVRAAAAREGVDEEAFLREVATRVWAFDGTHLRDFDGPFVEWEEDRARRLARA